MTHFWRQAALIIAGPLLLLTGSAAAQASAASAAASTETQPIHRATHVPGHKRAKSKPSPVPAPQPPPTPLTPEQMPPVPPQVTYNNGMLTIVATNSTLSDILHAVSARTGATLDAPAPLIGERVATHLGPATPREVLSDLLTGPRFDYILVGGDGDPNAVRSIILSAKTGSSANSVAMAQPQPAPADESDDEDDDQTLPGPGPMPYQPRRRFMQPQPQDRTAPPAPTGEGGNQQPIKTPEQLLEQLRRMQQQQQGYPQQPQPPDQR